jgi:hypothetical protein
MMAGMMAGATTAGKGLPWEEARDHHGYDVPSPLDLRRHCPPAPPGLRPIELAALEALCPGKHTELAITLSGCVRSVSIVSPKLAFLYIEDSVTGGGGGGRVWECLAKERDGYLGADAIGSLATAATTAVAGNNPLANGVGSGAGARCALVAFPERAITGLLTLHIIALALEPLPLPRVAHPLGRPLSAANRPMVFCQEPGSRSPLLLGPGTPSVLRNGGGGERWQLRIAQHAADGGGAEERWQLCVTRVIALPTPRAEAPLVSPPAHRKRISLSGNRARPANRTRFQMLTQWMLDTFGEQRLRGGGGVLDVAGGAGGVAFELCCRRSVPCVVVDPRPVVCSKRQRKALEAMLRVTAARAVGAAGGGGGGGGGGGRVGGAGPPVLKAATTPPTTGHVVGMAAAEAAWRERSARLSRQSDRAEPEPEPEPEPDVVPAPTVHRGAVAAAPQVEGLPETAPAYHWARSQCAELAACRRSGIPGAGTILLPQHLRQMFDESFATDPATATAWNHASLVVGLHADGATGGKTPPPPPRILPKPYPRAKTSIACPKHVLCVCVHH